MICVNNEIGMIVWFGVIILRSPGKKLRRILALILNFPGIPNQSELSSDCFSIGVTLNFTLIRVKAY